MRLTSLNLERLNFLHPDFTRWSWVSDLARNAWESRLRRITNAWLEIEWRAVPAGVRVAGLTFATPENLVIKTDTWIKYGLISIPLETQGITESIYSSTTRKHNKGDPFVYRVIVTKPESVSEFKKAWDENDSQTIGKLLGYPTCCQRFFREVWIDQRMVDTTWSMAATMDSFQGDEVTLEVDGPLEANILWRWMGLRAVPHLPCSFTCQPTVEFGKKMIQVGNDSGFDQEMDWMMEILSWPVEWSALHGIAEIKTPILKVSTRTDPTPWKYVVKRKGTAYPNEGARGLKFPYQTPEKRLLTQSPGYQRGFDNLSESSKSHPDWYASDNGFDSVIAMDQAHQPVVELALEMLGESGGNVLDLGCGNGALLKKIVEKNPKITPFGVEIDPERYQHIASVLPEFSKNFELADIFNSDTIFRCDRQFNLVILMPGRLLEADSKQTALLKQQLRKQTDHLLVYAYGDWLNKYRDLWGLANEVGLNLLSRYTKKSAGLVEFDN